ncbi:MAG: cytochrome c4 [Thiotrichales bacterium]|nr:cytochrome c4 [Thiotrichales bacterium]
MKKKSLAKRLFTGLALVGCVTLSSNVYALDRGELMANTCAGCHGPNGVSHGPATPSIAGMSADYFKESMLAYKEGTRPSTIMMRIAKGYSEAEIAQMATYFSAQKFESAPQKTDAKMVSMGQKIHTKYCEKCHSENGSLKEDDSGILAGQWRPYLQYNLHDFIAGGREAPKKMAKKLEEMHAKYGDKGVQQLIEFYSAQETK